MEKLKFLTMPVVNPADITAVRTKDLEKLNREQAPNYLNRQINIDLIEQWRAIDILKGNVFDTEGQPNMVEPFHWVEIILSSGTPYLVIMSPANFERYIGGQSCETDISKPPVQQRSLEQVINDLNSSGALRRSNEPEASDTATD